MARTPFEKALLGELKGIRKELQKFNKVEIPPPEELALEQIKQLMENQRLTEGKINADSIKIINTKETYNPLDSR